MELLLAGIAQIALVFQGASDDRAAWSGVPAGISAGLRELGYAPIGIDARAPGASKLGTILGMSWMRQAANPVISALSGNRARRSLQQSGPVAGTLLIGSGFEVTTVTPSATFDDMTVVQARRQTRSAYAELPPRVARRWIERQRRIYQRATACCATSEWTANSIVEDYGIDSAKVHVVGLGHNLPEQTVERNWERPRFLFVGVDWERKGGPAVLDAFARVRELHPAAQLDLIGGHPDIDQPGVIGHGRISLGDSAGMAKLAERFREATALVMPSSFEPFGIAYLDAGAAGVASIGTTNGGAATAIGDGGLLVAPGDADGLLAAMLELCDPPTARRLGERAFEHSRGFTWKAVARRILAALDRVQFP